MKGSILRSTIAYNVKTLRVNLGLSLEELAKAVPIDKYSLSSLEKGNTAIGIDKLELIAKALKTEPYILLKASYELGDGDDEDIRRIDEWMRNNGLDPECGEAVNNWGEYDRKHNIIDRWIEFEVSIKTKICKKCQMQKELTSFYGLNKSPDGRQVYCKQCANDYVYISKGYVLENGFWISPITNNKTERKLFL